MVWWKKLRKWCARTRQVAPVDPLLDAAADGDVRRVVALLESDADPERRITALRLAAQRDHVAVVEALLVAGGGTVFDEETVTNVMGRAAILGHAKIIDLLARDYPKQLKSEKATQALRHAVVGSKAGAVRALLRGGTPSDMHEPDRPAALFYAANRDSECVAALLEAGADPNGKDADGRTPLHLAARAKKEECIRLLLAAGADLFARNNDGQLPVDLAPNEFIRNLLTPKNDQPPPENKRVQDDEQAGIAPPESSALALSATTHAG